MAAGDHQADGEQAGDRQRADPEGRPAEPAATGRVDRVQVGRHPVGVDRGHDPIGEEEQVDDEQRRQDRHELGAEDLDARAEGDPAGQGDDEDRDGGEPERPVPGAGIGVPETGEDQGQEGGGEGRSMSGARFLRRLLHRG